MSLNRSIELTNLAKRSRRTTTSPFSLTWTLLVRCLNQLEEVLKNFSLVPTSKVESLPVIFIELAYCLGPDVMADRHVSFGEITIRN